MNIFFSHVPCPFVRGISIAVSDFRVAFGSKNFPRGQDPCFLGDCPLLDQTLLGQEFVS